MAELRDDADGWAEQELTRAERCRVGVRRPRWREKWESCWATGSGSSLRRGYRSRSDRGDQPCLTRRAVEGRRCKSWLAAYSDGSNHRKDMCVKSGSDARQQPRFLGDSQGIVGGRCE
ncbi:hypothetical protein L1887_42379 [Cichorium endivia]|nr:hypothetical protein L1887_42379 [Cichorium endivia]